MSDKQQNSGLTPTDAAKLRKRAEKQARTLEPISLSEHGLFLEANLTATTLLGAARSALVRQPISRFILKEDEDIYYPESRIKRTL